MDNELEYSDNESDNDSEYTTDYPMNEYKSILDSTEFYNNYNELSKERITDPCLTKYEKTKILSERTQQIENGSILYIQLSDSLDTAYTIALEEFNQRKLPFIICRPLPNSIGYEYWKLNDLIY